MKKADPLHFGKGSVDVLLWQDDSLLTQVCKYKIIVTDSEHINNEHSVPSRTEPRHLIKGGNLRYADILGASCDPSKPQALTPPRKTRMA
jgi:hypothetical protein